MYVHSYPTHTAAKEEGGEPCRRKQERKRQETETETIGGRTLP